MDILTEDVTVQSSLGTANGHADYKARVEQLPTTWQNAHFLKRADVEIAQDGSATLTANITYLNIGLSEDGSIREADLNYTMSFVAGDTILPRASVVQIEPNSDGTASEWRDAYAENRMKSLVHYWLALIEDPVRNPEPVREILGDGFSLNFSSGAITDFDGFKTWLAGPGSQVAASTHVISNFTVEVDGDHRYNVSMDFDWYGILPDGTELVAKTHHDWTVSNVLTERFARIQTIDVEVLEPFRPKAK